MEERKVDEGLYSFVTIARFHGIQVDPEQIRHMLALEGKAMEEWDILRMAKHFELKAKATNVSFKKLKKLTLPAMIGTKEGYLIAAKIKESGEVLILKAGQAVPEVWAAEQFQEIWTGRIILFVPRMMKQNSLTFGFKWFIPAIIKYKKPLLQVLLAAFTLQVFGLFSPIIMQVVIDKVLVHNSVNTLDVLVFALIVIALFEMAMSIAKNYVFTHTTNRIDVMLGAKVFQHLFSLPLRYFESRRVGDTVARVREIETIRNFLTGAPLTAFLDVLFSVCCLTTHPLVL